MRGIDKRLLTRLGIGVLVVALVGAQGCSTGSGSGWSAPGNDVSSGASGNDVSSGASGNDVSSGASGNDVSSEATTKQFDCPAEMPPSIVTDQGSQEVRDELDARVVDIACQMEILDRKLTEWRRQQPASDSVRAGLYPTAADASLFELHNEWLEAIIAVADLADIYPDSVLPLELPDIIATARSAQSCLDSGAWCYNTD